MALNSIVDSNYFKERTVVLIPSITIGSYLRKFFSGLGFYEERYLYFLNYLRNPKTRLVAVFSRGFDKQILDYFIGHCAQINDLSVEDIKKRFILMEVPQKPELTLTQNILKNGKIIKEIKKITNPANSYIEFFRTSDDELVLAKKLGLSYYDLKPSAFKINTKSGARKLFKKAGVHLPLGYEDIDNFDQVYDRLKKLASQSKASNFLIKMNDEGSGIGILKINRAQLDLSPEDFIKSIKLPEGQNLNSFKKYFNAEGGIAEEFVPGKIISSPSVQFEIKPNGKIVNLASHEQILDGLEYLGVQFSASSKYRKKLIFLGTKIAKQAMKQGARGILSIDFIVSKDQSKYNLWAIEINARKGGTNHTYMWVKYLTKAKYVKGELKAATGNIYYRSSEQFINNHKFKKINSKYLIEQLKEKGLDYDHQRQSGAFIHLLSPISKFGKLGVTVVGHTDKEIDMYWRRLGKLLNSLI